MLSPPYFSSLPAEGLLLYLVISKMSLWDPSVLTQAVSQHLLLSQHCFSKGLVGYGRNTSNLYSHGAPECAVVNNLFY